MYGQILLKCKLQLFFYGQVCLTSIQPVTLATNETLLRLVGFLSVIS